MALSTWLTGLATLWHNYMPWTQAVVVAPLIARARSRWMKGVWNLVLFATTAAFIVTSYYAFKAYFAYPKTTNIKLFNEPEASFPAVTFCSLNPFKKSVAHHSPELINLLATYNYVTKKKQAQMRSGSMTGATTTVTGLSDNHARGKREGPGTNEIAMAPAPSNCENSFSFSRNSIWMCPDETVFMEFEGNDNKDMTDFNDMCLGQFCVEFRCASCSVVRIDANAMGMNDGHYCKCSAVVSTVPEVVKLVHNAGNDVFDNQHNRVHYRSPGVDSGDADYNNWNSASHHCSRDNYN